jgi:GNAT superfamily N-acetyltransferase
VCSYLSWEAEIPVNDEREIREVRYGSAAYRDTVALRDAILRKPLGLQISPEDLAGEDKSYHLACYQGTRLLACLVLRPLEGGQIKMRQVAVIADRQGQGIGTALVRYSEAFAEKAGYCRMILHARDTAVAFYEKLGYTRIGDRFAEVTIPHWQMEKSLPGALHADR